MSTMKFIYGEEQYLIQRELKTYSKTQEVEPLVFDEEDKTENIISEISTISMFQSKKYIVLKNIVALSKNPEAKELVRALKTIDDTISIVVISESSKLTKTNDLIKFLLSNATVTQIKKISDNKVVDTIRDIVKSKGGEISNGTILLLSRKLPNNLRIIITEIDKLLLESNVITSEMVEISIGKYLIDDNYALSNAMVALDKHAIILAYNKLLNKGEEPTKIIGQMASTLNLAVLVSAYMEQGKTAQQTADQSKIHIFRIKKAIDMINQGSIKNIKHIVVRLAELDKNIKSGKIDKDLGLDRFILELIK